MTLRVCSSGLAVGVLLLGVGTRAAASENPMARIWNESAAEIQERVVVEDWIAVEKKAAKLGRRLMELVRENEAAPKTFARVAALRALALLEMGKTEDAEWFWLTAMSLSPEIADFDFGKRSSEWDRIRALRPRSRTIDRSSDFSRIERPKPKIRTRPTSPDNDFGEGTVAVIADVTTTGRLRDPIVVGDTTGSAAKRYSALEAMVRWRYTPATLDGVAVEVPLLAEVRFKVHR